MHCVGEVEGVLFEHLQVGEEVEIIQREAVLAVHNGQSWSTSVIKEKFSCPTNLIRHV